MKKLNKFVYGFIIILLAFNSCAEEEPIIEPIKPIEKGTLDTVYIKRAKETFDKVFELFWVNDMKLLYDKNPMNDSQNYWEKYAAVWGYGAFLSAYNSIIQRLPNYIDFEARYKNNVMNGLDSYWNTSRSPAAYASYFNDWDDRFYDDNVWVGIDLIELYEKTNDSWYLERAKLVWKFLMSGKDDVLGGGIYWKENEKNSKNTCSNAPAAVFGVKMYQVTKDISYLDTSKEIYKWTKNNLQDPLDHLYWDNKKTDGSVEKTKFSYNSGQMLQAAALLYKATGEKNYLNEAKLIAESAHLRFFETYRLSTGESVIMLKQGSLWFHSIMFRGFAELYQIDKNKKYIFSFRESLDHAWKYARDPYTGLFNADLSGRNIDSKKDILTQGAIVEMYARMATLQ